MPFCVEPQGQKIFRPYIIDMNKRYAILIAGSKFPEEPGLTELRCPEHDVDALNELLASPDFGQFTETVVFKNAPSHEVLEKIETVLADAGGEDLVLIYFSGHGKLTYPSNHLCLATVNTKLKVLGSTSIPVERIKHFFDAASTRKRILILDCCYSGAAGAEFVKGGVDDQLQLMSGGQGTFIMTASGFQTAVEKPGDSLSLFTKHLVEGIRSGEAAKDENGFISVDELYEYVHEKVLAEGAQEPMKWGLQTKGSMIIAKSGRDAKEKRRQELRAKLCGLAAQGYLPDSILSGSLQLVSGNMQEITAKDNECFLLIERLADERISVGDFVESWVKTCLAPEPLPVAKVSDSSEQKDEVVIWPWLLIALCVGAGWYFFSGRIESKLLEPLVAVVKEPMPEYIDNSDGTITDPKSRLMWKRCLEGLSGTNCEEGKVEKYTWDEAVKRFKHVEYAGHSDWRMPTIDELKTLLYCSQGKDKNGDCNDGSERPTINKQAFPNAEAGYFVWSGSPNADGSDFAWYVYFNDGYSAYDSLDGGYAVRLVRGGQ